MKTNEVLILAQSQLSNHKTIDKHKRNCADGCFKHNTRSIDSIAALNSIDKALNDEINGGLVLKSQTIAALNEVKRILNRGTKRND